MSEDAHARTASPSPPPSTSSRGRGGRTVARGRYRPPPGDDPERPRNRRNRNNTMHAAGARAYLDGRGSPNGDGSECGRRSVDLQDGHVLVRVVALRPRTGGQEFQRLGGIRSECALGSDSCYHHPRDVETCAVDTDSRGCWATRFYLVIRTRRLRATVYHESVLAASCTVSRLEGASSEGRVIQGDVCREAARASGCHPSDALLRAGLWVKSACATGVIENPLGSI